MKAFFSRLLSVVGCCFIFSAAWFCLWSISLHLVERPDLCGVAFPFGLRLGLMLQCPRGYWPVLLGAEWLLILWLAQEVALAHPDNIDDWKPVDPAAGGADIALSSSA